MHTLTRALAALMIFAAASVTGLGAQTCPDGEVTQIMIRPTGNPGPPYGNIAVALPDGTTEQAIGADTGWLLDLPAPRCLTGLKLVPNVENYVLVKEGRVFVQASSGLGIYQVELEPTWTLSVTAIGEKGPIGVTAVKAAGANVSGQPATFTDTTNYRGRFPVSEAVDLKVYTHGKVYWYNVVVDDLDADSEGKTRHDKREIMDGVCRATDKLCACQSRWTLLTCWAQKRDISTEEIRYTQDPVRR
ncbi:MAG: hypothetical protein ABFS14_11285 [Gemmatimonadota bacterium]